MEEVAGLELPTQEGVHADLRCVFRGAVKLALETVLDEVVRDLIGARRQQRLASRKDVRNGTYVRSLLNTMGMIEVAVPRTRGNGSAVDVIGRYRRRSAEIDGGIVAAYVHGASTRDIGEITEALRPPDLVQRDFHAQRPNQLCVADLTYVTTWAGFVYVAFVIDVFARAIVGWCVSSSLRSDLARTIAVSRPQPWWLDPRNRVCGDPGAVQAAARRR